MDLRRKSPEFTSLRMVLKAIDELWDELPTLIGGNWPKLLPQIRDCVASIGKASTEDQIGALSKQIFLLLEEYQDFWTRVREISGPSRGTRGLFSSPDDAVPVSSRGGMLAELKRTSAQLAWRIIAHTETRYPDISAPKELEPGDRGTIAVHLACKPEEGNAGLGTIEVRVFESVAVTIQTCQCQGIEISGKQSQELEIVPNQDSQHAVFHVTARTVGKKCLCLEFWQSDRLLRSVELQINVVEHKRSDAAQRVQAEPLGFEDAKGKPADLVLRVHAHSHNGQTTLEYMLDSPNNAVDFCHHPAGSVTIKGSPEEYIQTLFSEAESLAQSRDGHGTLLSSKTVVQRLDALGRDLYNRLFSHQLRDAYRRWRDKVTTILIVSDEPWIPWEMVKPYDDSDQKPIIDDDFLCMRFELARWLTGDSNGPVGGNNPAYSIPVSALACIAVPSTHLAGYSPLPGAIKEREKLKDVAKRTSTRADAPDPAPLSEVDRLLDSDDRIGLWHFAAHGNSRPSQEVFFSDGRSLQPIHLNGKRQTRIKRDRPLAFLNACRSGQQKWELSGLGGWADSWVVKCRCGAFIAPHWAINDDCASEFAELLFENLKEGGRIGHVVRQVRSEVRKKYPDDPTWLAYSVYAHPNARMRFGERIAGPDTVRAAATRGE